MSLELEEMKQRAREKGCDWCEFRIYSESMSHLTERSEYFPPKVCLLCRRRSLLDHLKESK